MKTVVLVMGAGTFQVGLIRFLKKYRYEVHVVTNDLTNAGIPMADFVHHNSFLDYSRVLAIIEETKAIQILSVASEIGIINQAKIQSDLSWNGLDIKLAELFSNKYSYKKLLIEFQITTPEVALFQSIQQLSQKLKRFPQGVMLKPVKGSGSKGVRLLRGEQASIINDLPPDYLSNYLIEEYIDGVEYGGDFIINSGKLQFYYPTVKSKNEHWVPAGHLILKQVEDYEVLKKFIQQVVQKMPLQDGVYNIDVIVAGQEPYLIDLSPRIGGNCIPDLVYHSWQINEWKFLLDILLNNNPATLIPKWQKPHGVYIIGAAIEGKIMSHLDHEFENTAAIVEVFWRVKIGEMVLPFNQGANHLGYVIYTAENDKEILLLQKEIESFCWIEIQ